MENNELVKISGLQVQYTRLPVLRGITLSLPKGEIIGLVGANGSGKTTLMRVIAGMIPRYSGTVSINGCTDMWKARADVCFLPSEPFYEKGLSLSRTMGLYSELFPNYQKDLAYSLCERFGLSRGEKLSTFSTGRRALALFILHLCRTAAVYLLDEPFRGIDIKTRAEMKNVLIEAASPDKMFLISTHEIMEMESLFDRVALIREGRLIFCEEADALRMRTGQTLTDMIREAI